MKPKNGGEKTERKMDIKDLRKSPDLCVRKVETEFSINNRLDENI